MANGRIMIVEDEGLVAQDLSATLARSGYEVVGIADSFDAGRDLAARTSPDLALLDIRLKGARDGIELAHELRRLRIGFVYLTSHSDPGTLARAEITEPLGYVLKPFGEREIAPVLKTALYRHAADLRQRNLEEWLQTTLRSIGDGVFVTDRDARVTYANPVGERMVKGSLRQFGGESLQDVLPLFDASGARIPCVASRAIAARQTVVLDEGADLVLADGTRVPVEDCAAPIVDREGEVTGAVIVIRDATSRRVTEEQRRLAEQKLFENEKLESLGTLAGGLAHDLNNILTAILGNVALCRFEAGPELLSPLREIESNAKAAAELCRRMLDGQQRDAIAPLAVDVGAVARDCLARERALAPDSLRFEMVSDAPIRLALADPIQFRQVLQNLVRNAVEAVGSRNGRIVLRIGQVSLPDARWQEPGVHLAAGEHVTIEVADDGPGIPPGIVSRVFDPFFSTKYQGRGLGLASVRGIVMRHGGAIWVARDSERGATFRVLWPAAAPVVPESGTVPSDPRRPLRLLFVDDDPAVRRATCDLLRALAWRCHEAGDGGEALGLLDGGLDVDAVVLDVTMPELGGPETLARIRTTHPDLPAVLISGYGLHDAEILRDPNVRFLAKPFAISELTALLLQLARN